MDNNQNTARRIISPVVYYGGKSALAPWIVGQFPPHEVYVELFCGGASVLLTKPRSKVEVINDINGAVTNFFTVARDRSDELLRALALTPYSQDEFEAVAKAAPSVDPVERARRFLVVARQAFNGCAESRPDLGRGNWKWPSSRDRKNSSSCWKTVIDNRFVDVVDRLQGVGICNSSFEAVIDRYDDAGTLFYADPPYLFGSERVSRRHTYLFDFRVQDMERLAKRAHESKARFIISHTKHSHVEMLFRDWRVIERPHRKGWSPADGGSNDHVTELLFMNFDPTSAPSALKSESGGSL